MRRIMLLVTSTFIAAVMMAMSALSALADTPPPRPEYPPTCYPWTWDWFWSPPAYWWYWQYYRWCWEPVEGWFLVWGPWWGWW